MGMREGSDPLALSRGGCDSRLLTSFISSHELAAGGCERVPTLSRSPTGLRFAAPASFVSSHELAAGDARGFRPSRSLPWGLQFVAPCCFGFFARTRRRGVRAGSDPLALSRGAAIRGFLLFFASPFVSPYSSGMRTVSDWGGTVTAVDSFLGCAESRFAERKSVWVTASGRVTRMSRSAERLYTR